MFDDHQVPARSAAASAEPPEFDWFDVDSLPGFDVDIPDPWKGDSLRRQPVPHDLASWEVGPKLIKYIQRLDRSTVSGYDLVTVLQAEARVIAHFQASYYSTIAELTKLPELNGPETASSEIAAGLSLTRQFSWHETEVAQAFNALPRVRQALRDGSLDLRKAKLIANALAGAPPHLVELALDRVLPGAGDRTTGEISAQLRRVLISADPEVAQANFRVGIEARRIVVYDNPDGTASLFAANLAPDRINAIRQQIEAMARTLKTADEDRTADQIRADVFLDLLENRATGGRGSALVNINIDLTTLIGLDDKPAEIPGYGPVIAEIGRKVVLQQTDSDWEFTATDQGQPVATGTLRRRPTTSMKRYLRSRFPTCVHPGCRRPARQSDLDHIKEWARGGPTTVYNLAPLCEPHHQLKDSGWSYRRTPEGGFVFTSPTGHTYLGNGQSP